MTTLLLLVVLLPLSFGGGYAKGYVKARTTKPGRLSRMVMGELER